MRVFRITFMNQGQLYQLHADGVRQGDLYGFVEITGLLFDEHTTVVIDPAEERLKSEFSGVERVLVPMHAVVRIDEVAKRGQNRILALDGSAKVTPFPSPIYTPKPGGD